MGCCHSRPEVSDDGGCQKQDTFRPNNKALVNKQVKWKSNFPMTKGQLLSKRDDFWETAPMFGGRPEIWDALKAAVLHAEQEDFLLAQAILDGANISLPTGTLLEAYDELGNHYEIPVYCLSQPIEALADEVVEVLEAIQLGNNKDPRKPLLSAPITAETENGPSKSSSTESGDEPSKKSSVADAIQLPVPVPELKPDPDAEPRSIKLRLSSTGVDYVFSHAAGNRETVAEAKKRFSMLNPDLNLSRDIIQRWFFGGKLLTDQETLGNINIPEKFVVQVILNNAGNRFPENGSGFQRPSSKTVGIQGSMYHDYSIPGSAASSVDDKHDPRSPQPEAGLESGAEPGPELMKVPKPKTAPVFRTNVKDQSNQLENRFLMASGRSTMSATVGGGKKIQVNNERIFENGLPAPRDIPAVSV